MPSRSSSRSSRKDTFLRANDPKAYKDLVLFEERLKTNAVVLNKRKRRYQLFLFHLLIIISFLLSEVLFETELLTIPYNYLLRVAFPGIYNAGGAGMHPYVTSGLLFVAVTTLALFFASGMYAEKIGYANRYVPHANRALRSFNMYLNVRHKPLSARLFFNPLSIFVYRDPSDSPSRVHDTTTDREQRMEADNRRKMLRRSSVPINPIPPTDNPRGELIFSSRVDPAFREGYEKYRTGFERRREEMQRKLTGHTWCDLGVWPWNWWKAPNHTAPAARGQAAANAMLSRDKGSRTHSASATPPLSRQQSPVPDPSPVTGSSSSQRNLTVIRSRLPPDRSRADSMGSLLSDYDNVGR